MRAVVAAGLSVVIGILSVLAIGCGTSRDGASAASSASASGVSTTGGRAPSGDEIRYLALGDSFTAGTGSPEEASFPSRLAERLRARGKAVTLKNLGVNGYRTDELLEREAPEIAPFRPNLVTLAIGANDLVGGAAAEHYRSQLKRIFAAIDAAGVVHANVLVLPQPDWSRSVVADSLGDRSKIHLMIEQQNDILREEAESWGARFMDLWPLMARQAHEGLLASDGLHPSATAYDAWADALAEALQ